MRTIIINTLGRELRKNPLFFLPFREDQMFWLEQDLNGIDACAEEISAICNDQIKRQDYRLVVLADPVSFYQGEVSIARECYKKLIIALLNRKLLSPLVCQSNLIPRSVTVVYLISRQKDGDRGIHPDEVVDHVFGISAQDQPIRSLRLTRTLPGGNLEYMDATDLFELTLNDHCLKYANNSSSPVISQAAPVSLPKSVDLGPPTDEDLGPPPLATVPEPSTSSPTTEQMLFSELRRALNEDLQDLQVCSYVPAGATCEINLPIRTMDFIPKTTVPQLIWADLQLDLCDYLAGQVLHPDDDAELELPAHTQDDLELRISRANQRVDLLLRKAPKQSYYPLQNQSRPSGSSGLTGRIWEGLSKEANNLPGVAEARLHSENPDKPRSERPSEKLRRYWFRAGQEKKLFQDLCTRLDSEYSEELVTAQQQSVLDICAREFRQWRSSALRLDISLPPEPSLAAQPELDAKKLREDLVKSQQACTRVTAEKLADYSDVRQEAEVIKAKARKAGRFWSPDCGSANTHFFQIYSLVLSLLFLVQIMLPYVGITLGQSGVAIDRYIHFLLSIVAFAGLYCVGLLIWLRGLCDELHRYSEEMSLLIWKSSRRREDSIEAAVDAYSSVLPKCMVLSENLRELEYIHATNEARKVHYNAHMDTLRKADELLQELATQLQLPDRGYEVEPERISRGMDYHLPPSHGRNLPYYTLLSDEWGDASC